MVRRALQLQRLCASVLLLSLALCALPFAAVWPCPPMDTKMLPSKLQEARRHAQDRGVLWRFAKEGHSGYLYGTLHVGKQEWTVLGRTVRQALEEVDILALELNLRDR